MSRDRPRRLPLASAPPPDVAADALAPHERAVPPFPLLAVVSALPEAERAARAQVEAFVRAAVAAGVTPAALVVRRAHAGVSAADAAADDPFATAGASRVHVVDTDAPSARAAVDAALASLVGAPLVVALGADVPAFAAPGFTVLVDAGAPLLGYGPMSRAIRDRVDARLADARGGAFCSRVVTALLSIPDRRP